MEQDNFNDTTDAAHTETANATNRADFNNNNLGMGTGMGMGMGVPGMMGGRNDLSPTLPSFSYSASDSMARGTNDAARRVNSNPNLNMGVGMGMDMNMGINMARNNYYQSEDDDEYGDYTGGPSDYRMGGMGPNGPGGSSWAGVAGGNRGIGGRSGRTDQYDEDGVRLPDQIISERMLGGPATFEPLGRADSAEVTWLFPPPRHLSFPGSLQEVL